MPALLFAPYIPFDSLAESPVWIVIDENRGVGEAAKMGDVVTVDFSAVTDGRREFASTSSTGLPYTFQLTEKAEEALVLAVRGLSEGGERYVCRRGLLLATGGIQPAANELRIQLRLIKIERRRS